MSDETVNLAAQQLSAGRWGAQKVVRLAHELELRAAELPETERVRLLKALRRPKQEQPTPEPRIL
jgi:hypothetical protein